MLGETILSAKHFLKKNDKEIFASAEDRFYKLGEELRVNPETCSLPRRHS